MKVAIAALSASKTPSNFATLNVVLLPSGFHERVIAFLAELHPLTVFEIYQQQSLYQMM